LGAAPPARVRVSESGGSEPGAGEPGGGVRGGEVHGEDGLSEEEFLEQARIGDSVEELLDLADRTAYWAGTLLRDRFLHGDDEKIESKSTPTDLVSDADRDSECEIRDRLELHRPEDGFLGEEGGDEPGTSGLRWVVDPLDGTVNFLFGIPQWCVSVAVCDDHGTVAGAIYDPIREEIFTVARGGEATMRSPPTRRMGWPKPSANQEYQKQTLKGSSREELSTAMVATGFAYDARVRAAQAQVLASVIPSVRDIRRFGSAALDLAWTAAGRYDAYFERTVKPWDIAAGTLLCEAAGLQVIELPEHEDLPWGILVAPPALCEPLLELVG
jgi:myo-inositol-1(or 4)-monophosphatase